MERLESIVDQMESDSLPLEDLLARFEEGLKLVKFCSEKLDSAEKRIEIISRDANGAARLVEFEAKITQVSAAIGTDGDSSSPVSSRVSADSSGSVDSAESENESGDVRLY